MALDPKPLVEVDPFSPFTVDIDCGLDEKLSADNVFGPVQVFNPIVQEVPGVAENVSQTYARWAEVTSLNGFMFTDFFYVGRISAGDGGAIFNGVGYLNGEDVINSDIDTLGNPSLISGFATHFDIAGGNGDDDLTGGTFDDCITGGLGNDTLVGLSGDDFLSGGNGADDIDGGTGDDDIAGGNGADVIDAGEGDDEVDGGNGADDITAGDGADRVLGGDGRDTITGDNGQDDISGGAGNDDIDGGKHADNINGDSGNDDIRGGNGDDVIDGGDDLIINGVLVEAGGDDTIHGGNGDDEINGNVGDDVIKGGNGDDDIEGGEGDDDIAGGNGDDEINAGAGNDTVKGGADDDNIFGGIGDDRLLGQKGDDYLCGEDGDDVLRGNGGKDTLDGGAGDDNLNGGNGHDVLVGGLGDDILTGGNGKDTFLYVGDGVAELNEIGEDSITDFSTRNDQIDFFSPDESGKSCFEELDRIVVRTDVAEAFVELALYNDNGTAEDTSDDVLLGNVFLDGVSSSLIRTFERDTTYGSDESSTVRVADDVVIDIPTNDDLDQGGVFGGLV